MQMQLFQINQSEEGSKITVMPIPTAASYISGPLQPHLLYICPAVCYSAL